MSTKSKFYTLFTGLLLLSCAAISQNMLELRSYTNVPPNPTAPIVGSGFGPRVTNHVITFDRDNNNNSNFTTQGSSPNPISPVIVTTVYLTNQQFTGLTYGAGTLNGAGTSNAVSTGLVFGAGPTQATGVAPGNPATQQASPLNSYDLMAAFGNNWGPRNGMFMSDPTAVPTGSPYPTQSGTGLNAEGLLSGSANDGNGGVSVFTCAQVMFDQGRVHNSTTRHYYGDVIVSFNRFISQPVIHIAGLGGSYRYLPLGLPDLTTNYLSTFFTTELELVGPYTMTKMASNQFLSLSGNFITNNNLATPNGESTDQGTPPAGQFNNFGAATGSIRINGPATNALRFRVYIRGASGSQFNWSVAGSAVQGAAIDPTTGQPRNPLTGDIWFISVSAKREELIPLPATGLRLDAALNGNDVKLNWKTLTEIDTREFEIQRSTDGINFTTIATKAASGSSVVTVNYSHTDPNMQVPVYYYRLKLVDNDNDFSYSNVVPVRMAGTIKGIRIFPNPATSQVNIEFSNAKGNYVISLYNQAGQEVATQKVIVNYSVQYIPVNRNSLPAGTYLMKARNTDNGVVFNEKLILQ